MSRVINCPRKGLPVAQPFRPVELGWREPQVEHLIARVGREGLPLGPPFWHFREQIGHRHLRPALAIPALEF
jgi:hypothetical protein